MNANPIRRKRWISYAGIVVVGLAVLALYGQFRFSMVCTRCGAIRDVTEWRIPSTRMTLLRTASERQSPVSTELLRSGVVARHDHQWLFSSGGGNGVSCAVGEGRYLQPAVESARVVAVLKACQQYGELQFRDRLVRLIFDPKTSAAVRGLGFNMPETGFTNAAEFRTWVGQATEYVDEEVGGYQRKAD